jgi:hypothetical protein
MARESFTYFSAIWFMFMEGVWELRPSFAQAVRRMSERTRVNERAEERKVFTVKRASWK